MYVLWSQLLLIGGFILSQGMQIEELSNRERNDTLPPKMEQTVAHWGRYGFGPEWYP